MGTMVFRSKLTKIKRPRRNLKMVSAPLAFHIRAHRMTTSQSFDYIFDPENINKNHIYYRRRDWIGQVREMR